MRRRLRGLVAWKVLMSCALPVAASAPIGTVITAPSAPAQPANQAPDDGPAGTVSQAPTQPHPWSATPDGAVLDLVGGDFRIADYADVVSRSTNLGSAAVAWNSARRVLLVAWHGYERAHPYDLFGREVNEDGTMAASDFPIVQDEGPQVSPARAYDAANDQYWLAWLDRASSVMQVFVQRLPSTGQRTVLASAPTE